MISRRQERKVMAVMYLQQLRESQVVSKARRMKEMTREEQKKEKK